MSGQFVRGSCAQNSQAHLPHPAGLTVGSSPLSGSDDSKPPAELEGAALRPRQRGGPPGRGKPGGDRRAVLPKPLPRAFLCCPKGLLISVEDLDLPVLSTCVAGDVCKRAELRVSSHDGRPTGRSFPTHVHLPGSQDGLDRRQQGSGAAARRERCQDGGLRGQMHRHLEGRADVVPSEMRWSRKHESMTLDL